MRTVLVRNSSRFRNLALFTFVGCVFCKDARAGGTEEAIHRQSISVEVSPGPSTWRERRSESERETALSLQYAHSFERAPSLSTAIVYVATLARPNANDSPVDDHNVFSLALRWRPFEVQRDLMPPWMPYAYFDMAALYLELGVGVDLGYVASSHLPNSDAVVVGPIASVSTSWLPMQGEDYAFGFSIRGSVERYRSAEEYWIGILLHVEIRR